MRLHVFNGWRDGIRNIYLIAETEHWSFLTATTPVFTRGSQYAPHIKTEREAIQFIKKIWPKAKLSGVVGWCGIPSKIYEVGDG
jgi:hypothetical protein